MSHFQNYQIGARRPGTIDVTSHRRGWPPSDAVPDPAGSWHQISSHTRRMPDVWDYKGQWNEIGATAPMLKLKGPAGLKVTKFKTFQAGDKVVGIMIVEGKNGAKLVLGTSLPIGEILDKKLQLSGEVGWNPWKSIKKAAKATGKGLYKVAKSPEFQAAAMAAAPIALQAFGVPAPITAQALAVVNRARQGDPTALAKVQNIRQLAQQEYQPAQKLYGVMSAYYRGGVPGVMQAPPQIPQYPAYPYPNPYGYGMRQAQQYGPQQQQYGPPQMPYGMRPFNVPTPGWGRGYVSGWFYNIPFRGPLAAKHLDQSNPFLKMRYLYAKGVVGARRGGRITVMSHRRGWPPSSAVPDPAGSWHQISEHTRRMPDVWDYKGQWSE